jgi:hypothetical protein
MHKEGRTQPYGNQNSLLGNHRSAGGDVGVCRIHLPVGQSQTVQQFAHLGYPQQQRIILGIAKALGAITLVVPGLVKPKEQAGGPASIWRQAMCLPPARSVEA